MRTTGNVHRRILGASAAVMLGAACGDVPPAPDVGVTAPPTATGRASVTRVRVIEPGELGLENPAGLAFSPRAGMLLVVTRGPGAPPGPVTDIALTTLAEDRAGAVRIAADVTDPVNMAFDGRANRLLFLQSSNTQLTEILARSDGSLDPLNLRRVDARAFGLQDPQGLAVDPVSGQLFILDAAGPRIVVVEPDAQRSFANPLVSAIDLAHAGLSDVRGLAFDPTSGHLHVLAPVAKALYELTESGRVVATRDLSEFELGNTHGMTFGPSGDATDDPSEMSLYIAESGAGGRFAESGQIIELSFVEPAAAVAATATGTLVRTVETSRFSPPSPDPSGITYVVDSDNLLMVDGEVEEMSIYAGANVFEASRSGVLSRSWTTISYSNEPTGAAWNPANRHLFLSDDAKKDVFEVDPGPDGRYGTSDDRVTSFDTSVFGSNDPEGVAYDISHGVLFIADGVNAQVYRVSPGSNGRFDGVPPAGDDQVTSFDTEALGLLDPEGIAHDSDFGHLYIVGNPRTLVLHVTTTGVLLRAIDISAAQPDKPAGLTYAPASGNPGSMNLWIVDRGVDNNSNPNENDGKAYEFSLPSFGGNALPTVMITAPANGSTYTQGSPITFTGTASDVEDGELTGSLVWTSSVDGVIGSGGAVSTSALSAGSHTIAASVTDLGGLEGLAAITVTVNPPGLAVLEVRVATGSDDAEQSATGSVSLGSSDLEMVYDGGDQTVGLRFNAVTIPPGATIFNAYVQFQVDEATSVATSLVLRGQETDNAATFSSTTGNISSRSKTTSSVSWVPPTWGTTGQAGLDQRTPNLASIVQEIVNRPGWASGNALAIIMTGTGERVAEAYEGVPSAAALLHVDYSVASNSVPTASAVSITGTPQVGQALTGTYTYGDANGDAEGSSAYRWLRNGVAISGAAATSYTLVAADQGAMIAFEVTPAAATGASPGVAVQSAAVGPVAAAPVVIVTAISPSTMVSGSSMAATVSGSGFAPGATLTFEGGSGPTPKAANLVVVNGGTITATITAKAGGPPRTRQWTVRVTNPGGATGVRVGGLTVTP